jgi:hypothetical protein
MELDILGYLFGVIGDAFLGLRDHVLDVRDAQGVVEDGRVRHPEKNGMRLLI